MTDLCRLIFWTLVDLMRGLHNHADGIAAMDLFVVPTISFRLLYGLLIVGHRMARRHSASDRRMDCKSDYGSLRLGTGSPLPDPRSRSGLWPSLHPTASINGHSRPTNVAMLPVAKWRFRTADRFDPTGMP